MSDENKSRRCSFELFPDERTGDKIADELIANEKLKERGRFMRAMLVTGAAFAAIDKRLPLLISELLTENTTLDDINKVISSVIPGAFSVEKKLLELLEKQSGLHTSVDCSTPLTEQSLSRNDGEDQTRRNAENMFGDDCTNPAWPGEYLAI
ncbi:recombinase [Escherichia coli]|nr:plasmid partitioning/stability family protein [Escherichia coli]MWM31569.1 recombinase [Escherichia coli]